ncbi:MAG: thioesterase family protein [Bacteroidota bacterium]
MNHSQNTHITTTSVRGYELDSYSHVNNSVYLNYFEHGRWELFRELNLTQVIHSHNILIVVTDVHIRYMREAKLFDEIEIQTRVVCDEPYLIFKQKLINRQTGLALARGETKTIFIDENRKPVEIPDEFKAILND